MKHKELTSSIPTSDLIIHSGDYTHVGYKHQVQQFCKWYNELKNVGKKIFINGNHEKHVETNPEFLESTLKQYPNLVHLQDETYGLYDMDVDKTINIYGSPWQPEFCNWGFNLPRNGSELKEKWDNIPENTDILITHGPPHGILDVMEYDPRHLGDELLRTRVDELKPKIHVFGHIHSGYGYAYINGTHFINAAVLNEEYNFENKPLTVDWNIDENTITFV